MSSDSVSVTLTHGPQRTWQQRWRHMLQALQKLEAVYDGRSPLQDTEEWEALTQALFTACHHMADWFGHDPELSADVRADAFAQLRANGNLALAAAISNTSKHHSRRHDSEVTAYIHSVTGDSSGRGHILLAWDIGGIRQGTRDALDLGVACVDAWRHYLHRHKLTEPV